MSIQGRQGVNDFNGVRDRVVALRCQGHGFEYIAAAVGLSRNKVETILRSEFEQRFADRDELKRQTAMQLDWLARPLMEKYERDAAVGCPDRRDAESVLKVIERKCRLLGLDDAVKIDVREVESLTDSELEAELKRHGVVRQLPAATPPAAPLVQFDTVEDAEVVERQSGDDRV